MFVPCTEPRFQWVCGFGFVFLVGFKELQIVGKEIFTPHEGLAKPD